MARNEISTLSTKEARQIAKLDLAAEKRGQNYDRDLLPTKYVGNDVVNNPNTGGLQPKRPWISGTPSPSGSLIINLNGTVAPVSGTWNDQTSYDHDATLLGGSGYSSSFGGMVTLNGTNNYVALPVDFIDWLHEDITVSVWVNSTGTGVLFSQQNGNTINSASGYVPAIYIGTNNQLYTSLIWHDDKPGPIPVTVNDSDWHMITVTYKRSTKEQITYVDGTAVNSITWGNQQISYGANYYYFLGAGANEGWNNHPTDPFLQCNIGSFKAWHGALTSLAIKTEFDDTKSRFLAGSHTLTVTHKYNGTGTSNVYIDLTKFPSAVNIPVGATITSSVLPGPATVSTSMQEIGNSQGWQIIYYDQAATRNLVNTDQFTFTWTV